MEKQAFGIVKTLNKHGFIAYFAGGCVRDKLLKKVSPDIDIATNAKPSDIEKIFEKTFPKGAAFGVMSVLIDNHEFEVTTFRKEGCYSDGRHPDHVEFTDEKQDAFRRDFTINGMFHDPLKKKVIDYVGGKKDLKKKIIRAIGHPEERFSEDKLRMLRAIRFASSLHFKIEEDTFVAIKKMAHEINQVSFERIRDEIVKILVSGNARKGFELLDDSGLLMNILPEISAMKGVEQPPQFHPEGDVFVHTMMILEMLRKNVSADLAVGALLHDVGKPTTFTIKERIRFDGHVEVGAEMAGKICRRLKFSKKTTDHVVELVKQHLKFKDVRKMRESTLKRFLRQDGFEDHLELHRMDCLACHGDLSNHSLCKEKLEYFRKLDLKPVPLLRGKDLIELGLKPGPHFRLILNYVEDAQLEGRVQSKEDALLLAQKHSKKL
ncbi:MAG: CCA tRNA nucleotidyltransferase, partial [Deltaproteobacteria bacterium]|nr:CCA tRNA nucleotidyltransferase [Deltaproteobacteria bacterium]